MTPPARALRAVALGWVAGMAMVSCSDSNRDVVDDACEVIVDDCDDLPSSSECLDAVGDLSSGCLECIRDSGCNYATDCARGADACRLPPELSSS